MDPTYLKKTNEKAATDELSPVTDKAHADGESAQEYGINSQPGRGTDPGYCEVGGELQTGGEVNGETASVGGTVARGASRTR